MSKTYVEDGEVVILYEASVAREITISLAKKEA
jgi:hypothetical protein